MKGTFLTVGVLSILVGGSLYLYRGELRDFAYQASQPSLPAEITYNEPNPLAPINTTQVDTATEPTGVAQATEPKTPSAPIEEKNPDVKAEVNLAVPFTSQAPNANWDMPYQEACEEASLIMVQAFFNKTALTPNVADSAILKVVEWENQHFGYYKDTTAEQSKEMAQQYFGLKNTRTQLVTSSEDFMQLIKSELSQNHLIVIPAAGRDLGNPNFTPPGPPYHMLVIKGYTKDGLIITNDSGTRRGHNYTYTLEKLFYALHDWNDGDVENGAKVVLVIAG